MKPTGIIRDIDNLGRVVVPMEIRKQHGWPVGQPMEIFTGDDETVILRPYRPGCTFCNERDAEQLVELNGKRVCRSCAKSLAGKVE